MSKTLWELICSVIYLVTFLVALYMAYIGKLDSACFLLLLTAPRVITDAIKTELKKDRLFRGYKE